MRKIGQLSKERKFQEAIPYAIEASVLAEKTYGPERPILAINLGFLADLYRSSGEYDKAEPIFQRALALQEKTLGQEHPSTAITLSNLAELYISLGYYIKAEPFLQRALSIQEKALGPEHPDVALSLNSLATVYKSLGDYTEAERLCQRALAIQEKALGPEHRFVVKTLSNLSVLYGQLGKYKKAEQLNQRALAIYEKTLGPEHRFVAVSLNNLALHYVRFGDYAKAEPLLQRALSIQEKALGPEHPDVALSLNNLAYFYGFINDYIKAKPLLQRALAIQEKALGPEHPDVAVSLTNLANYYINSGDYTKAQPLHHRALSIREKMLGPEHPDTAITLNNLAFLYDLSGSYDKAEQLFSRSLAISKKKLGPKNLAVATYLNNMGDHYSYVLGDYVRAEPLYQRALAIRESVLGLEHPDVAISLNSLGKMYAALDKFQDAYELLKRSQLIHEKLIDQLAGFTSESQKMMFLSALKGNLYSFLNLFNQHFFQNPSARIDVLNVWLKRKGVILESQKRFREALVYSGNSEAVETFQKINRIRVQLSNLIFSGPGKTSAEAYKSRIDQLQKQKEVLEGRMSLLGHAYLNRQKIVKADTQKVASSLPANSALVEFIRIYGVDFKATGKRGKRPPDHYLAFILHAGKGDRVECVDLGVADFIDQSIVLLKRLITSNKDHKMSERPAVAKALYNLIFKPLQKGLGKTKELFISPDGSLNLIPFEVLQSPDGRFLIEDYTFNYVAAGRDILGFGQIKEKGNKALIMGDPDFDMDEGQKNDTLRRFALIQSEDTLSTRRSIDMHGYFRKLPGTKVEVQKIMALLGKGKADSYTGREALEEILFNKGAPKILHLATHGFFLNDEKIMLLRQDPLQRGLQFYSKPQFQPIVRIENRLVRSGIALAGANRTLNSGDPEQSDGIVTAEKILGLRLRGTEMVVLSACNTGMGEVQNGEGVYGLRRAFTQAGSKSLVMSMWSVLDREAQELMVAFYENILSGKMNRCQALRQAALRQMEITKKRYGHPNPLYWGAFVFLGEQ